MTKQSDLILYLFDGQAHSLSAELLGWMDTSTRFTAFVDTYRDKIRKKIRVAREPENALDLRSELEVAFCLLNDRRFSLAYEPYASEKRRGPDFAVTYRANLVFNIEVARIRAETFPALNAVELGISPEQLREEDLHRKEERVLRVLLDKLGQMQSGMANLLVIHTQAVVAQSIDLERLMHAVKVRVEGKDPSFYTTSRYTSPAAFYKDFLLLCGILLWTGSPQLWINKQARPALPEKVLRLVWAAARG